MAMVTRWHEHTAPLPALDDTGDLPYVPALCREPDATSAATSPDHLLTGALLVAGYGVICMIAGAVLAVHWPWP